MIGGEASAKLFKVSASSIAKALGKQLLTLKLCVTRGIE
jgi:hypothetical protein